MGKIKLTFTEEHIKLIRCLRFKSLEIRHDKADLTKETKYIRKVLGGMTDNEYSADIISNITPRLDKIDRISEESKIRVIEDNDKYYGFDTYDLFDSDYWYDHMAHITGYADKVIKGTEEDTDGPKYPQEVILHMRELDDFLIKNLVYIEDILHQFCDRGGIKVGVTYVAYDHEGIWHTEDEWKEMGRK